MHYRPAKAHVLRRRPREAALITFDTSPERYRHWKLAVDGPVATLSLDVAEDGGLVPGYKLKLNSYDLGVDIELADALNRIRFEHPSVKTVVVTSAKERMFSAGANIYMLGSSSHAFKVNFCKFTNETRNGMEDSSRHEGLKFLAAVNGACAGGGYEVALACDEILMIDDRSSTVSLPEVPLLGVLPGTGGLSRLTDKRKVRRDLADLFCTTAEGVRADRARQWGLIDTVATPQKFAAAMKERAAALAETSDRPDAAAGVKLPPLERTVDEMGYRYRYVEVVFDRAARVATLTVKTPNEIAASPAAALAHGAAWWPVQMARELDDAILMLRLNEPELGTWMVKTRGDAASVLANDALLADTRHWFVRAALGLLRRTLQRFEVSSRSLIAMIDKGSCFAGSLFELALAADRSYMLDDPQANDAPRVALGAMNFGMVPMVNGQTRLANRFCGVAAPVASAQKQIGTRLAAADASALGLVTATPDALDWDDELRMVLEERASLSPDALTALEANLRFAGAETMATRIFGRLSAWQNWVFSRPNAVGDDGALKRFGTGARPRFNWERV
ncbi:MAG: benzoyl-CoA-dihydrodiol lyase [Alphaproteobacteria bacterium]|nr:benzoyl-CoA-dihydrodiol lyase [Alphaproteobacteria bacterium]